MLARFALQMVCGMSWMLMLMPQTGVRSGFFRVQMLIFLGLAVLGVLTTWQDAVRPPSVASAGTSPIVESPAPAAQEAAAPWPALVLTLQILIAVMAFGGSMMFTLERRGVGLWLLGLIAAAALTVVLVQGIRSGQSAAPWSMRAGSSVSTAFVLGGAMTAMLLGHAYLTAPGMSLRPLFALNRLFGTSVLVRAALSAAALGAVGGQIHGLTDTLWLALRWIAGIVGPLAACLMVARILRYKNTQSATGVLYVAVVLTLIGELSGLLVSTQLLYPM